VLGTEEVHSMNAQPSTPPADPSSRRKVTVPDLARMKATGDKIAMITAYDATFARLVDLAGIDVILVGDSVGMVVQGVSNTIPVDLDEMAYHVRIVARARTKALVVGDLPFGSYQVSPEQGLTSAIRLMKEGAECVKLEGGVPMAATIEAITRVDIPVMGHIGLTPQSYHRMGGHKVQGRDAGYDPGGRERLLEDAHAVEQAGACALVVEGVPMDLAAEISAKVSIPTIGIGAGAQCDGQVLVLHDVLGLSERTFTFAKAFGSLRDQAIAAVADYVGEVHQGVWPDEQHSFR
jgi:3-methyl-2-oxobutanoate hydroxymethyltransferase